MSGGYTAETLRWMPAMAREAIIKAGKLEGGVYRVESNPIPIQKPSKSSRKASRMGNWLRRQCHECEVGAGDVLYRLLPNGDRRKTWCAEIAGYGCDCGRCRETLNALYPAVKTRLNAAYEERAKKGEL
jgi:hypothetical protein